MTISEGGITENPAAYGCFEWASSDVDQEEDWNNVSLDLDFRKS